MADPPTCILMDKGIKPEKPEEIHGRSSFSCEAPKITAAPYGISLTF